MLHHIAPDSQRYQNSVFLSSAIDAYRPRPHLWHASPVTAPTMTSGNAATGLDYYATLAQVLPLLLLTIVLDQAWLGELGSRSASFWTRSRVRIYAIALSAELVLGIGLCGVVLAGFVRDADWLRLILVLILGQALITLLVRIIAKVTTATQ